MIVRPPKVKIKNFIPQPKYKNLNRDIEIENKENILNKRTKCDSYQRYFGKEITNSNLNNQNFQHIKSKNYTKQNSFSNNSNSNSQRVKYYLI